MILKNDPDLLELMVGDAQHQAALYNPGPYWAEKTRNAVAEIEEFGLDDFRGESNLIGMSYADNLCTDTRLFYKHGSKHLASRLTQLFPINKIYDSQLRQTKIFAKEAIAYAQEIVRIKLKERNLLEKYTVPYSLLGGCLKKANIQDTDISVHYLSLLEQHDNIAAHIDFGKATSVFEIGGGFGANVHLLLENYKNIRKVLYLDIPPNLYVGTQYLKAFYGESVVDYRETREFDSISFSKDDRLQIFCIAPWQIERYFGSIDVMMNSHSFVEMPREIAENYAAKFLGFSDSSNSAVALTTYGWFDPESTLLPESLPKMFAGRDFSNFEMPTLLDSAQNNIYYVSSGKLGK